MYKQLNYFMFYLISTNLEYFLRRDKETVLSFLLHPHHFTNLSLIISARMDIQGQC